MNRITSAALIAFVGLSLATPALASVPRARTAQAAWETARNAYRRGDYRAYLGVVAPESYDECVCQLSSIVSGAIGYELLEPEEGDIDELNDILDHYGVTRAEAPAHRADSLNAPGLWGRAAIARIADKPGLYRAVMSFLRKRKVGPELPSLLTLKLSDVVVQGTQATAKLGGRPRLRPEATKVTFDRHGDSWFIRLPPICLNDMPAVDVPD